MHAGGRSSVNAIHPGILAYLRVQYTPINPRDTAATHHNLHIELVPVTFVGYVDLRWRPFMWHGGYPRPDESTVSRFYVPGNTNPPFEIILSKEEALDLGLREE